MLDGTTERLHHGPQTDLTHKIVTHTTSLSMMGMVHMMGMIDWGQDPRRKNGKKQSFRVFA